LQIITHERLGLKKIICLGNATWDQTFTMKENQQNVKKGYASAFSDCGGGVAATAAVAIANWGSPVDFIGRVGADLIGEQIIGELKQLNVGVDYCLKYENAKSSIATVIVDEEHTSRIFVFNDPNMPKDTTSLFELNLSNVSAIVADLTWPEAAIVLFDRAKAQNIPTFLRVSFYSSELIELMKLADYCVMNSPSLLAMTADIHPKKALLKAQKQVGGTIVVTLSSRGCAWIHEGEYGELPAYPVEVIDTTGAGDIFIGILALTIGNNFELKDAALCANKAASLSCQKLGARNFSKSEMIC